MLYRGGMLAPFTQTTGMAMVYMQGSPVIVPGELALDFRHLTDVPLVFWGCGITPQYALLQARPGIAISHKPECLLITDQPSRADAMPAR